jgi:hypothetical protein
MIYDVTPSGPKGFQVGATRTGGEPYIVGNFASVVSDVARPFDAQRDQGGRWFAQSHGINSSMRFCGQPFTRRVMRSVK